MILVPEYFSLTIHFKLALSIGEKSVETTTWHCPPSLGLCWWAIQELLGFYLPTPACRPLTTIFVYSIPKSFSPSLLPPLSLSFPFPSFLLSFRCSTIGFIGRPTGRFKGTPECTRFASMKKRVRKTVYHAVGADVDESANFQKSAEIITYSS